MPKICQIDRDIESTDSSLEDGSPKKKRDFQPVPRERLNNEKVNDFKNSKGEAMSEMEVECAYNILFFDTKVLLSKLYLLVLFLLLVVVVQNQQNKKKKQFFQTRQRSHMCE